MTMTSKMHERAKTFSKPQMLDQELLYMLMDGLVKIGTMQTNGGGSYLKAELTDKGRASTVFGCRAGNDPMRDNQELRGGLMALAAQIKSWLEWDRKHRSENNPPLTTDDGTHIMALPVPFWPSHGAFERWIELFQECHEALGPPAQGSGVRSEEVIAWLDIRTAGLSWQNRIVATNPQFVKSNGPENFAPLYVLGCPAEERVNFNGRMVTWAEIEAAVQEWKQRASPVASTVLSPIEKTEGGQS